MVPKMSRPIIADFSFKVKYFGNIDKQTLMLCPNCPHHKLVNAAVLKNVVKLQAETKD